MIERAAWEQQAAVENRGHGRRGHLAPAPCLRIDTESSPSKYPGRCDSPPVPSVTSPERERKLEAGVKPTQMGADSTASQPVPATAPGAACFQVLGGTWAGEGG